MILFLLVLWGLTIQHFLDLWAIPRDVRLFAALILLAVYAAFSIQIVRSK